MAEKRRSTGRGGRRKKRWTKRRIRRYVRAWTCRILFALGILLILWLLISGVRLTAKTIGGILADRAAEQTESAAEETGTAAEAATEAAADPVIATVTITATGDCTLGTTQSQSYSGSFTEYYDKYGADYFFQNVKDIFESDDLTLVNLEVVLTETTEQASKSESGNTLYYLKGKPEYTKILSGSSVEAASLGNNHIEDYGEQGTADTEANLDSAGIKWALNETVGTYTTDEGIVIGFVSEATIPNTEDKEKVFTDGIQKLKNEGANLIICCCHWGSEKKNYPKDYQVELAHDLIDAGADLIIGNHPHVLQGFEVYKGKVICYSLGNCCFGGNRNPFTYETALYQQTFTFSDGVVQTGVDAQIIPCYVSSTTKVNDFQPTVAADDSKQTILDHVNTYSAQLGDVTFDSNGKLTSPSLTANLSETDSAESTSETGSAESASESGSSESTSGSDSSESSSENKM